ncbi:hypothetical protein D5S17_23225 [Pseudonocardiaceae bacterium YIM PH 21723]|nr:hypothetical protein D5S17_23225 [Pseudonocardiaceae bacterium YIM PH 21723]
MLYSKYTQVWTYADQRPGDAVAKEPKVATSKKTSAKPRTRKAPAEKAARSTDPEGMSRQSYYVTRDAADAIDAAVVQVLAVLGEEVPRHVALSALLTAGAQQAQQVAQQLIEQQKAELTARLNALQQASTS